MRWRGAELILAALCVAGALAGTVVAASSDAPVVATANDPTGDSGSGPDISSLTVTLTGDQLSFAVKLANRTVVNGDESVQLFITTPTAPTALNIAEFGDGSPPTVSTWDGTTWQGYHELPGGWSNSTFTTSISLDDLQSALAEPVRPVIWVSARSYTGATPGATPVQVDAAPDTGYLAAATIAPAAPTTTATPTPAASMPGPAPRWSQKIVRLAHARIEWTRLSFSGISAGTRVTLACTRGCGLTEHPAVSGGTAVSRLFVRHPFAHGQAFTVKFVQPNGAGWWSQITVIAKPGGQELATRDGCYLSDGSSLPAGKC